VRLEISRLLKYQISLESVGGEGGGRVVSCGWTDRQDDANSRILKFCNCANKRLTFIKTNYYYFIFCWPCISVQFVLITNLTHWEVKYTHLKSASSWLLTRKFLVIQTQSVSSLKLKGL